MLIVKKKKENLIYEKPYKCSPNSKEAVKVPAKTGKRGD